MKRYILKLACRRKDLCSVSKDDFKFDLLDNPKDKLQFHKEYFIQVCLLTVKTNGMFGCADDSRCESRNYEPDSMTTAAGRPTVSGQER